LQKKFFGTWGTKHGLWVEVEVGARAGDKFKGSGYSQNGQAPTQRLVSYRILILKKYIYLRQEGGQADFPTSPSLNESPQCESQPF